VDINKQRVLFSFAHRNS